MSRPSGAARGRDWLVPVGLMALALVPSVAGVHRLAVLSGGGAITMENARFVARPMPVILHVLTAIPFGLVGALLLTPAFRRRAPRWHRLLGRVLAPCGLVVALTGLWMTMVYPWPAGDGLALYLERLVFGAAMVAAVVVGVAAIARRDVVAHGAWMTRAYAIGMGAGTQVLTHLPWLIVVGRPGEGARAVLMGAGWVINLGVAEWVIRRGATGVRPEARRVRYGAAATLQPRGG